MRLAIFLAAQAAFAQDASRLLEQARDKVLMKADRLPRYNCIETIDRSYFSRINTPDPPPSCEPIVVDRQKGQEQVEARFH
jgi:hypothetical protein